MGTRLFTLFVLLTGCAAQVSSAEVADLKRRIVEAERQHASTQHKVDELENRVFLLTDQVETQKVASLRRVTRTLQPAPKPVVEGGLEPGEARVQGRTPPAEDQANDDVVFEGDARSNDPEHARPRALRPPLAPAPKSSPVPARRVDSSLDPSDDNLGVRTAPPLASEHTPPQEEPLALYRAAYERLRAGDHGAAEKGFREFVHRYPRHDYADNAQYWLAECFYDQKRYREAVPEFRIVAQRWPLGNKAPDALLKLGYSQLALGEVKEGSATLRELGSAYPRTEAARLAAERLTASRTESK
jgi:tol-pal system protein YbgF